ncbi:hypothetical protein HK100_010043, partial [Physocladia obscura]
MKRKQDGNKKATTAATTAKKTKDDGRKKEESVQSDIRTFFFRSAPALENRPDGYETGDSDFEESSLTRVRRSTVSENPLRANRLRSRIFVFRDFGSRYESQNKNTVNLYNNALIHIAESQDRHQIPSATIPGHVEPSPRILPPSNDHVAAPQVAMDIAKVEEETYRGVNLKPDLKPKILFDSEISPKECSYIIDNDGTLIITCATFEKYSRKASDVAAPQKAGTKCPGFIFTLND